MNKSEINKKKLDEINEKIKNFPLMKPTLRTNILGALTLGYYNNVLIHNYEEHRNLLRERHILLSEKVVLDYINNLKVEKK